MSALQNADSRKQDRVYKNYNIKQIHKHDKGNIFFFGNSVQRATNPGINPTNVLEAQLKSEQNSVWTGPTHKLLAPRGFKPDTLMK